MSKLKHLFRIIIILKLIILTYYLLNQFINYTEYFKNEYKIAVYSYNFGNYRNELDNLNEINKIDGIDYYFFSEDIKNLNSDKWNIIKYPLIDINTNMDKNRFTVKVCKFNVPMILRKYDYVIHIDSKKSAIDIFNSNITKIKLYNMINNNKNIDVFFREHSEYPKDVKNIYDEIDRVIKFNKEDKSNGLKWKNKLEKEKWRQKDKFIDCDIFMRKYSYKLNEKLSKIIYLMETNKIQRDQIILPYIIENPKNNIKYKILSKCFN